MVQRRRWTRTEKWTVIGVVVALVIGIATFFTPELRTKLGLEKAARIEQLPAKQNTEGAGSVAVNGNGNVVSTTVTNGEKK